MMMTYYEEFYSLMEWGSRASERLLASQHIDVLLDLSRDMKFDVLITEYFNSDSALGLAYKLNITSFIGMVSRVFCAIYFLNCGNCLVELCTDALALRQSWIARYPVSHSEPVCGIHAAHELLRAIHELDDSAAHQNWLQVRFMVCGGNDG